MKSSLWVDRYRPQSIADVIFQDFNQADKFKQFVAAGDIPNLLLSGIQGTGKTSVSHALIRDLGVDPGDVLKIKCSDEKIDAMRDKVSSFATTYALGNFKVVQLEEFDYLSLSAQALLRSLIEDSSVNCRFIATCNYLNKIIPPVRSRFQEFVFKAPNQDQIALRMIDILNAERIAYDPEDVLNYVIAGYPDIRKTIQLLQQNTGNQKLSSSYSKEVQASDWKFGLLTAVSSGDFKYARKLVCENAPREEHEDVFRFLYDNADRLKVKDPDQAIITIAEYLYRHTIVADTEINLAACMIELGKS